MYTHLDCIALRTTRLNDSKALLTAWSRQRGRITFAMAAGATPEARRRRALTAPLCTFEGECNLRPDREIHSLRDFRAAPGTLALTANPQAQMVAIFLGEVLDLLLRRSEADDRLTDFLEGSIATLATMASAADCGGRAIAAFPIIFLYKLTHLAGIGPNLEGWHRNAIFDMRDGNFRNAMPLHHDFLRGRECTALMALSRATYTSRLPLDAAGRRRALDTLLDYYSLHLAPLRNLRSLEIFRSLS